MILKVWYQKYDTKSIINISLPTQRINFSILIRRSFIESDSILNLITYLPIKIPQSGYCGFKKSEAFLQDLLMYWPDMRYYLLFALVLCFVGMGQLQAQVPQAINYQGVVRDANGDPIVNSTVNVRFTIRESSPRVRSYYGKSTLPPAMPTGSSLWVLGRAMWFRDCSAISTGHPMHSTLK